MKIREAVKLKAEGIKMGKEVQSILDLLPENLETILGHLKDEESSKKAALVCPTFHDKICFLRKDKPQVLCLNKEVSWKQRQSA